MATKKTNKSSDGTLKFTNGAFYQDKKGNLWCCTNARVKKVGDNMVVIMQATENGKATGIQSEEPVDAFIKQLTAAELKEYREVCQREKEAETEAKTPNAETKIAKTTKSKKVETPKPADKQKKLCALDAAAKVLEESGEPMASKEMIEAMSTKGYWTSPGGQTPHATLYAAILREINLKGAKSRFTKTDRGRFAINTSSQN